MKATLLNMAGFRLFGQTLTSETFASAGALFSASDSKISLNGDAEKTTLPFHSLRAKANPSGEMFPTNGDGCVQELQLLPTGEVSGNTDTHSRSGGKESMLRSGHTASQSEGSAGQPAATFLSMSSTSAAASSFRAQPSQGAPLSVNHKHEPRSSKGLVKIKVKVPRLQPSQNFQEETLAKKPKIVIINRRLNLHRKEEVEKEPVKSHSRPDAPQVQDSELLGQDNKEPNRQKTIAKSVSGSSHIEALPPANGCTIRDEDVHAGQSEPHDINILTHKERQGRDTLLHIEEETKADRESNEDANAEKKEEEKEERKQDLKGRVATPPPGIIFRRGEDRPRLQVLGCGLGMRWKEATNRGVNTLHQLKPLIYDYFHLYFPGGFTSLYLPPFSLSILIPE